MAPAEKKEDAGPWSGKVAAGYAETSGNSESSAANFKGEGRYDKNRWPHILGLTAVGTSSAADRDSESETTAEAYWAGYQAQYDITEALYGFGSLDWYKDRFSAYDQQMYEAVGIGWRILRGEVHFLDVEVGAGAKQADLQNGESQDEAIGLLRGVYTWKISKNSTFVQKLAVLSGSRLFGMMLFDNFQKDSALENILELTLQATEATSGSLILLNEEGQISHACLAYQGNIRQEEISRIEELAQQGLVGWVIRNRQPALVVSTREDPRWLQRDWDSNQDCLTRSALAFPVTSKGRISAVFTLVRNASNKFTQDDLLISNYFSFRT